MVSQFNNNIIYLSAHSEYTGPWESNNPNNLDINYEWVINRFIWLAQSVEHLTRNPKAVGSIFTSDRCHGRKSRLARPTQLCWPGEFSWTQQSIHISLIPDSLIWDARPTQLNLNGIFIACFCIHAYYTKTA